MFKIVFYSFFIIFIFACSLKGSAQFGNKSNAGLETCNFGEVDLSIPNGKIWSTTRAILPGYFSAVNNALYTNASDAHNIDGYVKKYGNEFFTFPVGTSTDLRTLSMSAPTLLTDAYATAWILGDPTNNLDPTLPNAGPHPVSQFLAPIVQVSNAGQWDWQVGEANNLGNGTTGDGDGLGVTVSMVDLTGFAQTNSLRLVGWNGTHWIDLSGAATATGNTENHTVSGTMIPGITAIAVGSVATLLPITINNFTATPFNCDVRLQWSTGPEMQVNKYIIEQSNNGINFTQAAEILPTNNNTLNNYTSVVYQPTATRFYRIKTVNRNGSFEYSQIKTVQTNCSNIIAYSVYPNPATTLTYISGLSIGSQIKIYGSNGQLMYAKNALSNVLEVNILNWAAGTYIINITNSNTQKTETIKFIKGL